MEFETLQRRHREEMERFQQNQLQHFIQQQQQASTYHQHPLIYHTVTGKLVFKSSTIRKKFFHKKY